MGTLKLDLRDVYGDRLEGRATVRLENLRPGGGHTLRDQTASRRLKVDGLEDFRRADFAARQPSSTVYSIHRASSLSSARTRVRNAFSSLADP